MHNNDVTANNPERSSLRRTAAGGVPAVVAALAAVGLAALLSACAAAAPQASEAAVAPAQAATEIAAEAATEIAAEAATEAATEVQSAASQPQGAPAEAVVYTSDLPESALYELEVWEDPASPGGTLLGATNYGADLDAPPENDPHATFAVPVSGGVPYRCWVHMKVGAPQGVSQANVLYVQFANAVDEAGAEILTPESESYLTAQGPTEEGWTWVGCDLDGAATPVYFAADGETTVRVQAGMEGVGFDQFVLSPAAYLEAPPADAVVAMP